MERMVKLIARQYEELLPADQEFYTPQDLYEQDIPDFIVKRVIMEIDLNLSESIIPPHSEWADMAAESVQEAWMQFLDLVAEEHRLPASFASSVFETAVADTLEIALQPREAIPAAVFGPDERLEIDEVRQRVMVVTVYKHLASAIVRYMERKQKKELTLAECKLLVKKIDEKLVQNYNSLNWAQVLGPVFEMAGPEVDTNFFRIFFEDKGKNRIARKFDLLNTSLNKTQLIEVLSSPENTGLEDSEDDHPNLFETDAPSGSLIDMYGQPEEDEQDTSEQEDVIEPAEKTEPEPDAEAEPETHTKTPDTTGSFPASAPEETGEHSEGVEEEEVDEEEDDADSILHSFRREPHSPGDVEKDDLEENNAEGEQATDEEDADTGERQTGQEAKDGEQEQEQQEEEETPLHSRFRFDLDASDAETEENPDSDTEETTLYKEMNLKQDWSYTVEKDFDEDKLSKRSDEGTNAQEKTENAAERRNDSRQVSRNIAEILSGVEKPGDYVPEETDEEPEEAQHNKNDNDEPIWKAFLAGQDDLETDEPENDGFIEEPVIDLTKEEIPPEEKVKALSDWLKDDEARFVSGIFGDSEFAYEQALEKIYDFSDWKSASRYIEKEVFTRNLVNVYDEVAVDFTDRLHTFFIEFKS